ncbi:MAG: MBL fold metallo-hydrolase [Bryobacterales bacterium]|nr:MBL fold metallo-hydrolase [Bryobacteraceae bacterium]MDW8355092.1 MBL fold metallo-hydrolase [Bryobacterales bacterium]
MRVRSRLALVASLQFGLSSRFDCHVWALRAPGGAILIDAGSGWANDAVLENLEQAFGTRHVAAVLLTHSHPDHALGAASLRELTGCAVFSPAPARRLIEEGDEEGCGLAYARRLGVYPAELRMKPCPVAHAFAHGERFTVAGQAFQAIQVRGHSEDSFCLLTELDGMGTLFSGDVVFYGGLLGLINAPGSTMEGYRADLARLQGLNVEALLPGHGLFTLRGGQRHIDCALNELSRNFLPRMIGQGDLIF